MKAIDFDDFSESFNRKLNGSFPLNGQIELTYRCGLRCVHCYLGDSREGKNEKRKELSFFRWRKILDQISRLGGLYLTLTGGDPMLHQDFFEIYDYALRKGFLVSVFTTGLGIDDQTIRHFLKQRPFNIEITLNGISLQTYESITGVAGSFQRVMENIKKIKENGLPLVLKTNGLKENRVEILQIKEFIYSFLGKGQYKFDSFLMAGLDGALEPTKHRLEPAEILRLEAADPDMQKQRLAQANHGASRWRSPEYLYQCNSWMQGYFIDPYGRLQFCHLSGKYATDLTKSSFKEGFFKRFPQLLEEKYKTRSKCVTCEYKETCYHCPARAFIETGDEEAPVEYFCRLAAVRKKTREKED